MRKHYQVSSDISQPSLHAMALCTLSIHQHSLVVVWVSMHYLLHRKQYATSSLGNSRKFCPQTSILTSTISALERFPPKHLCQYTTFDGAVHCGSDDVRKGSKPNDLDDDDKTFIFLRNNVLTKIKSWLKHRRTFRKLSRYLKPQPASW